MTGRSSLVSTRFDPSFLQVPSSKLQSADGFSKAAKTEESRKLFASNVKAMLDATGADGILHPMV
jgi:hypothetical protein